MKIFVVLCLMSVSMALPKVAFPNADLIRNGRLGIQHPSQSLIDQARTGESRIVGGTNADINEFPWQASLQTTSGFHFCGASLISQQWLVTAAHCVDGDSPSSIRVGLGSSNKNNVETYFVNKIVMHPNYGSGAGAYPNDIALLRLSSSVSTSSNSIGIISLASGNGDYAGQTCTITGWGRTSSGSPNTLQKVDMKVMTNSACKNTWGSNIISSHVCIENSGASACSGDSGGPLVCGGTLVGATSWGHYQCDTRYPSVYTRISSFRDWIRTETGIYDSTVKKSDAKKRKAQQFLLQPPNVPPPPPPPQGPDSDSHSEMSASRQDSESEESASTVSQTSYDPSQPCFKNMESEIPDSVSIETMDTVDSGSSTSVTSGSKPSKGIGLSKLLKFGKSSSSNSGGIVLLSNKSLDKGTAPPSGDGGITLLSKRPLDVTSSADSLDGVSLASDVSSSYMVQEYDDEDGKKTMFTFNISGTPAMEEKSPSKRVMNQIQSASISDWTIDNVCHWLMGLELDKYIPLFEDKNITGSALLQLDGTKLRTMGVANSKDRELMKKKIKDIKQTMEKEKKMQEKEKKAKEKEQKKQAKKK